MGKLIIFAHRGQGPTSRKYINKTLPEGVIPENSIKGFKKALEEGAEGFELDVFLTNDQKVVVCHDDELDRNVNGRYNCWGRDDVLAIGKISQKTLQEVQELDIGNGEHMPSLQEVIDLAILYNDNPTINIEIKGKGPIVDATFRLMENAIKEHPDELNWGSFMINSFDSQALESMSALHPDRDLRISQGFYTWGVYGEHDNTTSDTWLPVARDRSNECGVLKLGSLPLIDEIAGMLKGTEKAIVIVGNELYYADTKTNELRNISRDASNTEIYQKFLDSQAKTSINDFHLSNWAEITPIKTLTGNNTLVEKGLGTIKTDDHGRYILKQDIDVEFFERKVEAAKQQGCTAIDVVSSDLSESMMQICNKHKMAITATTNAIRAKAQKDIEEPNHGKAEEEIEKDEIKKMFDLGQKYPNVDIYYKADDPQKARAYREELEQQTKAAIIPVNF